MKRRILSVLATCCLLATMTPVAFAAGGNLTQVGGVYQIDDAADLVAFANLVNGGQTGANAVLTNTIDLGEADFTPIGSDYNNPYSGTFDGAGYTIKNATITGSDDENGFIRAGVFGCVDGTIKRLTLENIDVDNTSTASSGNDDEQAASGVAVGALINGGTVDSITVTATCSVNGIYRTGGIVGSTKDGGTTIQNCTNYAAVVGTGNYTGGIAGAAHNVWIRPNSTGSYITNCDNYGNVTGTNEVGGIVGYADRAEISSSNNYGNVVGTGNYGTGGIVGCDIYNVYLIFAPGKGSTISDCTNTGTVTAPRAGGILGSYVIAPGDSHPSSDRYSTISGCTNTGAISSANGAGKCGAIYGAPISYAAGDGTDAVEHMIVKIQNCFVGGSVENNTVTENNLTQLISASTNVQLSGNTLYNEVEQ